MIDFLRDVYRSLVHHGFTRIVTFNGHRLANLPVIQIAAKEAKASIRTCCSPASIRW